MDQSILLGREGRGIWGRSLDYQRGAQSVQSSPTRNKEVTHNGTFGGIR